ncbi:MAG: hypothetical protein OEZ04_13620 [Nitrospinota bacterium]|nr:hypothetical protein [Nitrospinota bacterium]
MEKRLAQNIGIRMVSIPEIWFEAMMAPPLLGQVLPAYHPRPVHDLEEKIDGRIGDKPAKGHKHPFDKAYMERAFFFFLVFAGTGRGFGFHRYNLL